MTPTEIKARFPNASRATILRNLGEGGTLEMEFAAGGAVVPSGMSPAGLAVPARRIRQSSKPLLNQLETAWLARFRLFEPLTVVLSQAVRLRLANGAWYKPDHFYFHAPVNLITQRRVVFATAIECKGPKEMKNMTRGMLTLKVAATEYPQVRFLLSWKDGFGGWQEQDVLP